MPVVLPRLVRGDGPAARGCRGLLGHAVKSKVEAAYVRSDLLNRRRILMQAWADYLSDDA